MDLIPRKIYFDDLFDNFGFDRSFSNMKCDVYEKGGDYHIEIDIPGFDKKDISIETKNDYLIVTAEKDSQNEEKDDERKYICQERTYGKYQRSFYVGDIEPEQVEAEFTNGILKITVPKQEKSSNKKTIEIK